MRRARVLVVVLLLLSGCNGLGFGDETARETVTPAPIPTAEAVQQTGETPRPDCLVPRAPTPVNPSRTTTDRSWTLPSQGTPINGSALVAIHDRVLPNHSYHARFGDEQHVWSLPGHAAFAYQRTVNGTRVLDAYAVGGRLSLLRHRPDGPDTLSEAPYRPSDGFRPRSLPALTGADWLERVIGHHEYTVYGTRTWNGIRVRVLRAAITEPTLLRFRRVVELDSTVYVDTRGIIRRVRHYERYRPVDPAALSNETNADEVPSENAERVDDLRFAVTDVDITRIPRPDGFCGREEGAVRVGTPSPNGTESSRP